MEYSLVFFTLLGVGDQPCLEFHGLFGGVGVFEFFLRPCHRIGLLVVVEHGRNFRDEAMDIFNLPLQDIVPILNVSLFFPCFFWAAATTPS